MARVSFTKTIQRHVDCPSMDVDGETVRDVLNRVFEINSKARGYVLDDEGAVRKHMMIFVNGQRIEDWRELSDPVPPDGEVYVMQALSGG